MKILLIDDVYVNNLLLKSILEDEGYNVEHIEDSEIAIEFFMEYDPDLIILDLRMKISGIEILKLIRKISDIPIIILTCIKSSSMMKRALQAGCNEYIIKPFGIDSILRKIERYKSICKTT